MRRVPAPVGALLFLLSWSSHAAAEEGVYRALADGGVGVRLEPGSPADAGGALVLESTYGLTDRFNWEGPLLVDFGRDAALTVGSGLEYVYFGTNHWRMDVGMGVGARTGLFTAEPWRLAPYTKASVRWLFTWGIGASLGIHLVHPLGTSGDETSATLRVYPMLSLYQKLW